MRPFVFQWGGQEWPTGASVLHVSIPVDLDRQVHQDLRALIEQGRRSVEDLPITCVDDQWLHVTLDQVTDRAGAAIPARERAALADELARRVTGSGSFEIQVGSLLAHHTGIIADLAPDESLQHLHRLVHLALLAARGQARGEAGTGYEFGVAHLTLGYARADVDSDLVAARLRRIRPSHARLRVEAVDLVEATVAAAVRYPSTQAGATDADASWGELLGFVDTILVSRQRAHLR